MLGLYKAFCDESCSRRVVHACVILNLSAPTCQASSLEPSPREYGTGGTYFPRSYSYNNPPSADDAFAERQALGAAGTSKQPKRHRRTQSLDPRLSMHSGDSGGTPRLTQLSIGGRAGSLQAVRHRISTALHRGSQARPLGGTCFTA